jgi:hypothetical protein
LVPLANYKNNNIKKMSKVINKNNVQFVTKSLNNSFKGLIPGLIHILMNSDKFIRLFNLPVFVFSGKNRYPCKIYEFHPLCKSRFERPMILHCLQSRYMPGTHLCYRR